MLVRTKIALSVGVLSCVALTSAFLLVWAAERSSYNHTRTYLAYEGLNAYLQLNGAVFRTFKSVRRDLLGGSGELQFNLALAEQEMRSYLKDVEDSIYAEQALGPTDTMDAEMLTIRIVREEIENTLGEVREATRLIQLGDIDGGKEVLLPALETRVDQDLADIIADAIALERSKVSISLQEVELVNRLSYWTAVTMAAITLCGTIVVMLTLILRVSRSLRLLSAGADRFAGDELDREINVSGNDEFASLGNSFNSMARRIRKKQLDLTLAQNRLVSAHQSLQQRDALRSHFFADIGHELRTPVAAIRGEAEVALRTREGREEAQSGALEKIVGLTEQLMKNVSDLFLVAREQAGVLDLRLEPVDLAEIAQNAVDQMATVLAKGGAKVRIEVPQTPVMMEGDEQRLTQLLQIMLSNSVHHSTGDIDILIEVRQGNRNIDMRFSDNGPGIPPGEREQVFERYYRGSGASSKGTGLGLPIARSLTQAHGGRISVCDSCLGGACFRIVFPRASEGGTS